MICVKTQELIPYSLQQTYLNLFGVRTNAIFLSLYNMVMKLIFCRHIVMKLVLLGSSSCIVWYMRYHEVVQ
jgi:hypothetical protein